DRDAVVAAQILSVKACRIGDSAAVDAQLRTVDVIQRVRALVVVGVECLVLGSTPQLRLIRGLLVLRAGKQPARRDAGLREAVVVGPAVERGVLRGLSGGLE